MAIETTREMVAGAYAKSRQRLHVVRERVGKPLTLAEKIIFGHLADPLNQPLGRGKTTLALRPDRVAIQDATAQMAILQFMQAGRDEAAVPTTVHCDHLLLAHKGAEFDKPHAMTVNKEVYDFLSSAAARYGMGFWKPGSGIIHQVVLENYAFPGGLIIGTDSHTPNAGGLGMVACGVGGADAVDVMVGMNWEVKHPLLIGVKLTGAPSGWTAPKDVILKLLEILTTKGNVGSIVEYGGDGVETLSVPERATITNMGAELGVTTSIFPSDKVTKAFLKAQGREEAWVKLKADPSAKYDRVIDIDLSALEPMVAMPHSPDNVKRVREIAGKKVHQVLVGSCTNASYKDITTLARILAGRTISTNVSFGVAAGSRQVLEMAAKESSIATLVGAGARILETACGFCIGAGQAPPSGGVSVRTNNRNFEGRSGTKDAGIFLVSAETAAACALKGEMADPRDVAAELGIAYPEVKVPKKFHIDDSMVLSPAAEGVAVEVLRGPNIGKPPESAPLPEAIRGAVTLKVGDKITTDHIMPAGARLKYRSNIAKYAEFVFEGVDPTFSKRSLENKAKGVHNVIVGGLSYGQGSSREHAAICPSFLGVRAVITKSFERIHSANLINFGIVPFLFANEADCDKIAQGDEVEIPNVREAIRKGTRLKARNVTKGFDFDVTHSLTGRQVDIILAGGRLAYTKEKGSF